VAGSENGPYVASPTSPMLPIVEESKIVVVCSVRPPEGCSHSAEDLLEHKKPHSRACGVPRI